MHKLRKEKSTQQGPRLTSPQLPPSLDRDNPKLVSAGADTTLSLPPSLTPPPLTSLCSLLLYFFAPPAFEASRKIFHRAKRGGTAKAHLP